MLFKKGLSLITAGLLLAQAASAMLVHDPFASLQHKVAIGQRVKQLLNMAQQIKTQAEIYKETLKSTKNTITGTKFNWDNIESTMNQLALVQRDGEALAYSAKDLDNHFQRIYPGYGKKTADKANYQLQYKKWVNTNQDTMKGTLKALNLSYKDLQNEKDLKTKLQKHARTAKGQMEAAQVANEIAAEEVNQLQKLRQIIIANSNAQVEYQAFQAQKDAQLEESYQDMLKNLGKKTGKYKENPAFGKINLNQLKGARR